MSKLTEYLEKLEKSMSDYRDAIQDYKMEERESYIRLSQCYREILKARREINVDRELLGEFGFTFNSNHPELPESPIRPEGVE